MFVYSPFVNTIVEKAFEQEVVPKHPFFSAYIKFEHLKLHHVKGGFVTMSYLHSIAFPDVIFILSYAFKVPNLYMNL